MVRINKNKKEISTESVINTIWISTFLALIFALPPIGIFLWFYFYYDNLLAGVILGFSTHFVALAFSEKISKFLIKVMN